MSQPTLIIKGIDDNPDGWGPTTIPPKFKDILYYAPYNKGDKVGKAADWQALHTIKQVKHQKEINGASTNFNWYYQDDDSSFQLVDNTKTQGKKYGQRRYQKGFQQFRQKQNVGWVQQPFQGKGQRKGQVVNRYQQRRWGQQDGVMKKREPSIQVKEDWKLIEEFEFNVLSRTIGDVEPVAEEVLNFGSLEYYNKQFDMVTTKSDVQLEHSERKKFNVTTSDDPIIRQLNTQANVFATDTILSHLMTCTKSIIPWDIVVQKVGNRVFFDKREGSTFDLLTVNETAADSPVEDQRDLLNSASALSREATFVNQNFVEQVLLKNKTETSKKFSFPLPNPFQSEGQDIAPVGYRYRKFKLGDDLTLIARCEVDGITESKGSDIFLSIKTLFEFDPKLNDWRKKIDSQRGAVLATEIKNNSFKLSKWTVQAILAGAESIKLGYVSRLSAKDANNHQILTIQDYKPKEFGQQMNINLKNAWGIVKKIVELIMKQPAGKYIIMKDPERSALKIYSVPENAFETSEDKSYNPEKKE